MSIPRNLGNFADNVNANGKVEVTGINATGTPSASTVLYGNGTWAAAGGGGSAATPTALGTVYGSQTTGGGTPYLTAYGYNAGTGATGTYCTYIGRNVGDNSPTGARNVIVGVNAFEGTGTGNYNVGVGFGVFAGTSSGANNVAVGTNALNGVSTGASNVGIGFSALSLLSTAGANVAVGEYALNSNNGNNNTAVGHRASFNNTTGSNNVAIGYQSLNTNTTGDISVAVGMNALQAQTTATQNTAVGYGAGVKLTTSSYNVAIGTSALGNMVNGANQNVAIGQNALLNYVNTSVSEGGAVAVGASALQNCTTGGSNIAMGRNAGLSITTGALNVVIGDRAGESANSNYGVYLGSFCGIYTTGDYNTFLGWQAGHNGTSTTTGSSNIYVGAAARGSSVSSSSEIVIGVSATAKGSSTGFINPNNGGVYQGNNSSSWSTTSDQRLKKNIADNNDGLDKINSIRVRNFEYRLPEEVDAELKPTDAINKTGVQLGVIAQELQAVLPECVKQESTGVLSVDTDNLTWYLINAVKQLKIEIDQLKGQA